MKLVKKSQTKRLENSDKCIAYEYPLKDKNLNGAVIVISGRYPDKGCVMNEVCKELVFVLSGSVKLNVEGKDVTLERGDEALIEPGERYYWDGKCKLFIVCTPAWFLKQHREVN